MAFNIASIEFEHGVYKHPDTLGFHASHRGGVTVDELSRWGRGDHTSDSRVIPLALSHDKDAAPSEPQIESVRWLVANPSEAASRLDRMVESAWRECYYGEHRPADEETDRRIDSISIPPRRGGGGSSKIVFTLDQDWEVEHGFFIILDPGDPAGDAWCWWDGLEENEVTAEADDNDEVRRFDRDIEQALSDGDLEAAIIIAGQSNPTAAQLDEMLILAIAEFEVVDVMNMVMMNQADPGNKRNRQFTPVDDTCATIDLATRLRDHLRGEESGEGSAELNQFIERKVAEAVHEFGRSAALERIEQIVEELSGERSESDSDLGSVAAIFGDGPLGRMVEGFEQLLEKGDVHQLRKFADGARDQIGEMQKLLRDQALGLMQQTLTPDQKSGAEPLPVNVEATMLQTLGDLRQHPAYAMVADVDPRDAGAAQAVVDRIGGTGGSPWFEVAEFAIDGGLDDLLSKWVDAMPDVNERHNERTLLHLAVLKVRPDMASYLIARGADIHSRVTLGTYAAPGVTAAELSRDMRRIAEAMVVAGAGTRPQDPRGVYDALQVRMRVEPREEVLRRTQVLAELFKESIETQPG